MAATTVTTRAVKGSALTHNEMDQNWNNLNNVGVGVGHISMWPATTLPDSTWLACEGQSVATATYPDLFDIIGYTYGGSGANFELPDYRGMFLRGWANGSGNDPDRGSRTDRGDGTTGDNVGTRQSYQIQSHTHVDHSLAGGAGSGGSTPLVTLFETDATTAATGGSETRPRNVNVRFIIKALL